MSVAVIGAGSLIAKALKGTPGTEAWHFLGHTQALASQDWARSVSVVLNCAFDDRLKHEPYQAERDVDRLLTERLTPHPHLRYVMLSSRMVYGTPPEGGCLHTALKPLPINLYGRAKLQTEEVLRAAWGQRLTILRLSNIFGLELQPQRRNFFAIALQSLRERQRVVLDINPFVERDFLAASDLAFQLVLVLGALQAGTFNLGAGFGVPVGRVAQWLIEGYGRGELAVTQMREHDAFWLDMATTRQTFGLPALGPGDVRQRCLSLGMQLRELPESPSAASA